MRILITGAARGLGLHLARTAAQCGHTVFAGAHNLDGAMELVSLAEQFPGKITPLALDVTDDTQVVNATGIVKHTAGALDVLINNAAIMVGREDTIETLQLEQVRSSMEVNLLGPMRLVQSFLPLIQAGINQAIINISSEAGTIINAFPSNYPYALSKTALNMFSERLREHLREKRIRVFAIHPGWMRTNMGGDGAPGDPAQIAKGILDIAENKTVIYSKIAFIDATGRPMPL